MKITPEQSALVEHCLPRQRGHVSMTDLQVINAMLQVAGHGCKWRGLPERFGNWHTVYTRMRRWAKVARRCIRTASDRSASNGIALVVQKLRHVWPPLELLGCVGAPTFVVGRVFPGKRSLQPGWQRAPAR